MNKSKKVKDRKLTNSNPLKTISVQALEPRILLDAAAAATIADAAVEQLVSTAVDDAITSLAESGVSQTADNDAHVDAFKAYMAQSHSKELVVIDSAILNPEEILTDIDPTAQVVFIDADTDGVEQLASILSSLTDIDALHIMSHGEQGQLRLGSSVLNEATMAGEYAYELALIGNALTNNADILIYGCDFAGGADGSNAAARLSELTGADIAASVDDTGAAVLGGDWHLEHTVGEVNTRTIAATSFTGLLAPGDIDGDGILDDEDIDSDNDGIIDLNELPGRNGWDIVSVAGTGDQTGTIDTGDSIATVTVSTADGLFRNWDSANFGDGTTDSLVNIDETTTGNGTYTTTFSEGLEGFELFLNNWGASADGSEAVLLGNFTLTLDDGTVINNADFTIDDRRGNFPEFGSDNELLVKTTLGGIDYVQDPVANGNGFQAYGTIVFTDLLKANGEYDYTTGVTSISFDKLGDAIGPSGYFAVSMQPFRDTDQASVSDHLDLDSDNDGISDLHESGSVAGIAADTDGDGFVSVAEAEAVLGVGNADVDGDGLLDIFDADITDTTSAASAGTTPVDTDGDGIEDIYDLDTDNDGIPDAVEGQPTVGYTGNDGNVLDNDVDGDGIIDIYDGNDSTTGDHGGDANSLNTPEDTDGDGTPDYRDSDSDDDGLGDLQESGLSLTGIDSNGDGIDDGVNASFADPDGDVNVPLSDLTNADSDASDADYRTVGDKDGDGVPDAQDLDADGDGILDSAEGLGTNSSNTVFPEFKEFDTDGITGFATVDPTYNGAEIDVVADGLLFVDTMPLSIGDVIVHSMNGGQDLIAFTIVGLTPDTEVNFEFRNPGEPPKIEIRGEGSAGSAEERVQIEFGVYDPNDPAFAGAGNLGDVAALIAAGNGTLEPTTTSISIGDIDADTNRLEGVGVEQATVSSFTLEGDAASGSLSPVFEGDFIRFRGTQLNPSDRLQLNFFQQSSAVVELLTDSSVTAGYSFRFSQSGFIDPQSTAFGIDIDGDGIPGHCDLDSDNDGISDLEESGNAVAIAADTDGDGFISAAEATAAGFTDTNNDGVYDQLGNTPVDSDGDGVDDFLDLDSDNDGIPDVVEGQPTNAYVPPTGMDSDGDGVDDAWDTTSGHGADFVGTEDTDGDGAPDHIDEDADGDGIPDSVESGLLLSGTDANGDGIDDSVNASYSNSDGDVSTPLNDLENGTDNDATDVDYRSVNDKDGDGVGDFEDRDADGDGITDTAQPVPSTSTGTTPALINLPSDVAFQNNTNVVFSTANSNAISITDTEGGTDNFLVTVEVPVGEGTLTLGTTAGLVSYAGQGTESIFLTGNEAQINAALEGLTVAATATGTFEPAFNLTVDVIRQAEIGFLNGSFEEPNFGGTTFTQTDETNVPGWDTSATDNRIELWKQGFQNRDTHSGGQFAELNANQNSILSQTFTPSSGAEELTFTFAHMGRNGVDVVEARATDLGPDGVVSGDDTVLFIEQYSDGLTWGQYVESLGNATGNPILLEFEAVSSSTGNVTQGNFIDSITVFEASSRARSGVVMGVDTDGDGVADHCDLDSDNDGISDLAESGNQAAIDADTDGDGVVSATEAAAADFTDTDGDGVYDQLGAAPLDTDNDGLADYLDLDSDNDGIPDVVEGQPTNTYVPPTGMDSDGDGVDDAWDTTPGHGGSFVGTEDTDGDGTPDFLDQDSDGDGIDDTTESGLTLTGTDADGDGIDDSVNASYTDPDGDVNTPINDLENGTDNMTADVDYRSLNDKDWDGVADINDADADGDGILDSNEVSVISPTTPIDSTALNSPGLATNTPLQDSATTAQLNGLLNGLLNFEAELVDGGGGAAVAGGGAFMSSPDLNVTFFNEQQFSFAFGLQNTTATPLTNWTVQIANANYTFVESQFTNDTAFDLVTTANPDGTFTHEFIGTTIIPPFGGLPGGNIGINGINFGVTPTSDGLVTGFGGGSSGTGTGTATGGGTGPTWASGVQIQNSPSLGSDFIFVQPEMVGGFPDDFAEYTFNLTTPVENFSLVTTGINFNDVVVYEAFFQGNPVPITAANFSGFTDGVVVQNGNELFNPAGAPGADAELNTGTLTIAQQIDQIVVRSGKADGSDSTATLGFTTFTGDILMPQPGVLVDTDGDGLHDACDPDSDNDGISDLYESGNAVAIAADTDGSGVIDQAEALAAGFTDSDGDGAWDELATFTPVDTDGDGVRDSLDLDSDNDGIPDAVEAQATAGYQTPSIGSDADDDGILDTFDDPAVDHGGAFTLPVDTDGDNTPDYLDQDSDNDGVDDTVESGLAGVLTGADLDGDGIDDGVAPNSYNDTDGVITAPINDLTNIDSDATDVDYRSVGLDPMDDVYVTNEDTPVLLDPLANDDSDIGIVSMEIQNIPDASTEGSLTYVDETTGATITVAPGAVLTPAEAATLVFTPVMDFAGPVPPIGYLVTDETGLVDTAQIDITVTPTPDAVDDPFVTNEDTPIAVNPIPNDDDGAGIDSVTIDSIPDPAVEGELTYTDDMGVVQTVAPGDVLSPTEAATLTFVPVMDFNGTVPPIDYTLTDINGETSEADILIEVLPTPDAVDDPFITNEDTPVAVNPIPNDDDGAGIDSVTIDSIPDPAVEGVLTYTDDMGVAQTVAPGDVLSPTEAATLTFVPVMDFNGTVPPINYTLTDINGETSEADILIEVIPTPDAVDDPFITNEDTPIAVNPIPNDDDGAGIDSVTIDSIPDPAVEGELTYTDDMGVLQTVSPGVVLSPTEAATLTFVPVMDFTGTVPPIDYTLTDINGETSEADILIEVIPTPDAVDDPFVTNEDTPIAVNPIPNDDDGAGIDSVTVDSIPDPAVEGELTYTDDTGVLQTVAPGDVLSPAEAATLTFVPVMDFSGTVPPIDYTLTDINGETSEADILIEVIPTPDAVDDPFVTNEDTPIAVNPIPNDDDGAGIDSVTVDSIPDPAVEGALTYTDDTGVLQTVAPGDVLSPTEAATLTFVPVMDFSGTVPPIDYTLTDINGETSEADILIEVTPTPDAVDDPFTTNEDTPVGVNPIPNDDDGAGIDSVTVDSIPDPAVEGALTYTDDMGVLQTVAPGDVLSPTEAATLTFVPVMDFSGTVPPIDYTLTDINGETSEADILIEVIPTPDAVDDPFVTNEDTPVSVNPIPNDDDGAGIDSVTVDSIPDPAVEGELTYTDDMGVLQTVAPGDVLSPTEAATLMFVPVMDFSGTVPPIDYTLTDINGETSEADILIEVIPTPDAVDDPFTTNEDTPVGVNPIPNDDDGAGIDSVTVDSIPDPAVEGELTYTDDTGVVQTVAPGDVLSPTEAATLTFVPVMDFSGTVPPIDYTLTDINGETSEADVLIEVTPTPDALDDPFTTNEDTPIAVNPIPNDDDGAGIDSVTVDLIPDPAVEGVLTYTDDMGVVQTVSPGDVLSPTEAATLMFDPVMDFSGTVPPIDYTLTDINGETSEADILIEVIPTPDALDDPFTTNEDTPIAVNPIPNDDDGAGIDSVTIDSIPDPAVEGALTYTDDMGVLQTVAPGDVLSPTEAATLTFVPVMDFNGTVPPIDYTLTDINGETSEADILIEVIPTPDAVDDPFTTNEDTPVSVNPIPNDDDGAGIDSVTVDSIPDPAVEGELTYTDDMGVLQTASPGDVLSPTEAATLTFVPVMDFSGTVPPIDYTLTDINGETSEADILIEVIPTPDATDDPFITNEDTPIAVNLIPNDDDGAGIDSVTIDSIPDPAVEGELTYTDDTGVLQTVAPGDVLSPTEAATLTFVPVTDFSGTVPPIDYTLTDINGETSEADILIEVTPAPDAVDDPFTTNEDTPVGVNPIPNDDDGAGIDSVTVDSIPDPAVEGELTYTDDTGVVQTVAPGDVLSPTEAATLMFVPVMDFNGTVPPINYTLTDVNGETSEADILIEVIPTPDAMDDPFTTNEDTPVAINPIPNDDDGAGIDSVTIDSIPDPAVEGELTYTDDTGVVQTVSPGDVLSPTEAATLMFDPVMDFIGTVPPVDYTLTDINGETSEADILIEVGPTPDALDDPFTTNEDTPVSVNPIPNDDEGAGIDSVTVDSIPDPAVEGELTYTDDMGVLQTVAPGDVLSPTEAATLTFVPVMDFNGTVPPIDYTLTDINGETSEADILIEVIPTPDAVDDPFTTNEDTPIAVNPIPNDDDGAGIDSVTIDSIPDPAVEGELTYTDDTGVLQTVAPGDVLSPTEAATLMFVPVMDFSGAVPPIDYTLTDVNGETSEADILIEVTPTPDALDDPFTTNEDTPVNVNPIPNDDDGAGVDSVTVDSIPDPAVEGELTYTDDTGVLQTVAPGDVLSPTEAATLMFVPVMDFSGTVPPIDYTLTDVNGETSEADILIEVTPTPDALDDPFTTNEDTPVNVNPIPNDDDGAGIDSVTVDSIPDPTVEGSLTYTDDMGVLQTASPGDVLSPTEAATLMFVPVMDFNGTVPPINYTLTDINGETSEADILIEVISTPDAVDDPFTTNEDTPVAVNPIPNDDDGAGIDSVTIDSIPDPAVEGELTYTDDTGVVQTVAPGDVLSPTEAATLMFDPVMNFIGTVPPVDYTLTDINGETSEADILIEVGPTPDALDDPFTTNEDTPINVNPIPNDDDGAGVASVTVDSIPDPTLEGELTYTDDMGVLQTVAPGDVLSPTEAATLTFVPVMDFNGTVPPIDYTLTDINGETSEADILIEVIPTPDAVDDPFTTNEDTPVSVNPIPNDDDGAGIDSVTVDSIPDPAVEGELTYTDDTGVLQTVTPGDVLSPTEAATLMFVPVMDFSGAVPPINYTLTDINGETSEADILIEVTPTPDALDDPFTTNEDTPVNVNPIPNDDDGAGVDSVTVDSIPDPAVEGELTYTDDTGVLQTVAPGDVLSPTEAATLMFVPVMDFSGTVPPIDYTLTDINGETSEADILIEVTPTPDAVDDPFTTNEDTPVAVNPIPNDDDGAGIDSVTVDSIPDPTVEGSLTYTDDMGVLQTVAPGDVLSPTEAATLVFVPVMDFNGTVPPINYTLTDINGETSEADILIEVIPTPDAMDDPFTTNEDTPVAINPIPNDDDGAGIDSVTIDSIPDPAVEGALTYTDDTGVVQTVAPGDVLSPTEAATLMFDPVMNFIGTVPPVDYTLTDVNGETSEADILIEVGPTPDAMDDPFTTNEDTPINVNPIPNDDEGAGVDSVTIDSIPDPALEGELTYTDDMGVLQTVAPGDVLSPTEAATLTFVPVMDFNGTVPPINYTLTDINGETSEAAILIEVIPTPDVIDDPFTTNEDTPVGVNPIPNDDDGAGIDSVTIDSIPDPAVEGELTYTDDTGVLQTASPGDVLSPTEAATLMFVPVMDFNGTVPPINYTLTDVNGETSEADILIEVTPTPDAADDPFTIDEDTPANVNPIPNDDDGAGIDSVTVDSIPDPTVEGELTYTDDTGVLQTVAPGDVLSPTEAATLEFLPVMDFNGTVPPINYTLTDINGETSEADVLIEVIPTPDALDDPFATNEDTPVNVNPISNDDDGSGVVSVTIDSIPDPTVEGELTYTDDMGVLQTVVPGDVLSPTEAATLEFTPVTDFNGTVPPINYTLTDINGDTSEADILIEVIPTPDAMDDPFTTNEDTPVAVNPIPNDDDGAGIDSVMVDSIPDPAVEGALTYTDDSGVVQAVVPGDVLSPTEAATLEFTPVMGFNGSVPPIDYTLTDVNGETSEADILIAVMPTPNALDDLFTINEDTPGNVNPIPNDDDGTGVASVTVDSIPDPAVEGELTYTDDSGVLQTVSAGDVLSPTEAATLTFIPAMDFDGTVPPINYTLTDVNGETSEADVLIEVIPTPDALDDLFTTNEDAPVVVNPIPNDDDGVGIDSVTVNSIPDPAVEGALTYTDDMGVLQTVLPGDVLSPAEAATLTFTPVEDFNGSVPPINYTLTDINGETSEADILIEVNPVLDAVDDSYTAIPGTPVLLDPFSNDDLTDGVDSVTVNSVPDPATEGELTYIDASGNPVPVMPGDVLTPAQAATLTFVPADGFVGVVPPINYTVTDVNGDQSSADILIEVPNAPPVAVDETVTAIPDTPLVIDPLANESDPNGDPLTITEINGVSLTPGIPQTISVPNGTVTVATDGTITVTPDTGFAGNIDVPYTITDPDGQTSSATHTVEVPNTPPVAVDITVTAQPDTPFVIDPLANDSDPNGDPLTITEINGVSLIPGIPQTISIPNGTVTVATDGTITVTPDAGFAGDLNVPYTIADPDGETSTATLTAVVPNTPPIAVDSVVTVQPDTPFVIDPLANDSDPNGDPLTITEINGVTLIPGFPQTISIPNGTVTVAADGTITVTPDAGFAGDLDVPYTITDPDGETSTATFTAVVPNTPPIAVDSVVTAQPDTPVVIDPLANDSDPNGDPLTITEINGVSLIPGIPQTISIPNGTVTVATDGTITVTPDAGFAGDLNVPYTITDPDGETSTATFTAVVPNTPPIAVDTVITAQPDTPVVINPLENDRDPNGDPLTITEINGVTLTPGIPQLIVVTNGTVTVEADGTITVTSDSGFTGDVNVPYTITDPDGQTSAATFTVEIPGEPAIGALVPQVQVAPVLPVPVFERRDIDEELQRTGTPTGSVFSAEGVVGTSVNELSSLSGISSDELLFGAALPDPTHDFLLSGDEANTSEGFSSGKGYRGTHSVDPTDECGRVFVDTINQAGGLSITARSTIDPTISAGVTGFTVTLANGEPLPEWISEIGDGEFLLDRSVDIEAVALKIVSHRDGASDLIRHVEIDTLTGQIREQQQAETFGSSFYETIDTAVVDE